LKAAPAWVCLAGIVRIATARAEPLDHVPEEPAVETRPTDVQRPPLGLLPEPEDALVDPSMARSWGKGPPRYFTATTVDLGFVYARPRISFGYGRPFTEWFGIDANPIGSRAGLGAYTGLRLELPVFDVRVGGRYFWAFQHTYLQNQSSYDRLDLETSAGGRARTLTWEVEADGSIPAGPGAFLLRGSLSYVTGVPEGQSVFEETLHVIVEPPLVWRGRAGYALRFGDHGQHAAGLVADVLHVPKREDSETVRAGPIVKLGLSRRVEVRGTFVVTLVSPDRIGLVGGDFTELGVRYRWASE
jgi:hypothetical protein